MGKEGMDEVFGCLSSVGLGFEGVGIFGWTEILALGKSSLKPPKLLSQTRLTGIWTSSEIRFCNSVQAIDE